jgi:hypothetical protein
MALFVLCLGLKLSMALIVLRLVLTLLMVGFEVGCGGWVQCQLSCDSLQRRAGLVCCDRCSGRKFIRFHGVEIGGATMREKDGLVGGPHHA